MRSLVTLVILLAGWPSGAPASELQEVCELYNAGAQYPLPELSEADLARLEDHKVVRLRLVGEPDAPQTVVGLLKADVSRDRLWLAIRDPHEQELEEITALRLSIEGDQPSRWYQHLDVPRPFKDRHWIVDVWDNLGLAAMSGGSCWEHWWTLAAGGAAQAAKLAASGAVDGIDAEMAEASIYTPFNQGAWLAMELPSGGALLGYHVTTVVGGSIPDRLVADYSLLQMRRLLQGVVKRAVDFIPGHYDAAHEPILGGDGLPIPPQPVGEGSEGSGPGQQLP